MSAVYRETILALKHFMDARRRLDAAERIWDNYRPVFNNPHPEIRFGLKSEYLGEVAREFLSAHNAYKRLGSSLNYRNNDGHYPNCLHVAFGHPCYCNVKIE